LVDEEERASPGGPFIYTNGLPRPYTANEDAGVMGLVEGVEVIESGVPPVGFNVFNGGQGGALRKKLIGGPAIFLLVVGPRGRRIGGGLVSRHRIKN